MDTQIFLSQKVANFPLLSRLDIGLCLWALLPFPLNRMTESTKRSSLFLTLGAELMKEVWEQSVRTCTHHSISLGSRSFRSSFASCRQRSWYSGCLARLYRIQERPLAMVSWPERQPSLCLWDSSAPEGGQRLTLRPSGRMGRIGGIGWLRAYPPSPWDRETPPPLWSHTGALTFKHEGISLGSNVLI